MKKLIIMLLVLLLVPSVFSLEELNIQTLDSQSVDGPGLEKTSEGYARASSDDTTQTVESWWVKLINFFKSLVGLQSISPQDFGTNIRITDGVPTGKVAEIGESPPTLGPNHLTDKLSNLLTTEVTYYDISTNRVVTRNVYYGAQFDFRTPTYGGSPTSLVSEGVPHIKQAAGGYVKIDESSGTATWIKYGGIDHAPSEDWITKYDFYVDREGFGVEFSDSRNMVVLRNAPLEVPLTFTNNIAEGILCSAEITIKYSGFYTSQVKKVLPPKKCVLGDNTLSFLMNVSQLGNIQVSALAVIYQPSHTKFSTFGKLTSCSENYPCGYNFGNETLVDDFTVNKNYEVVSQSTVSGLTNGEAYKTIQ